MFRGIKRALEPPFVEYRGLILPPRSMRLGSMPGKPDQTYVKYAAGSAKLLETLAGASAKSSVLDIGSGPGRLLIGMQARWGGIARYCGLDVNREAVDWARTHLRSEPAIEFLPLDIRSERYNAKGRELEPGFEFPVTGGSFDLAALFSVFSHMRKHEIAIYLDDLRRVLSENGRIFCTLFVEDGVPEEEENPPNYLTDWSGPLHCVRLNRSDFEATVTKHGWRPEKFRHRAMASGQSIYVFARG